MSHQRIYDAGDLRKYRTELPNLYDDSGLDVYEFRLLAHYKRVGRCTEGTETTARKCLMSIGKVSQARKSLAKKKFIALKRELCPGGYAYIIVVVDRWAENFQKYSQPSPREAQPSPREAQPSPRDDKEETIKKEPIKNTRAPKPRAARLDTKPLLATFCELTGIPEPLPSTDKQRKAIAVLWWQPARQIIKLANGASDEIVHAAVQRMRRDGLTISSPKSIVNVATAIYGEMQRARTPDL